MNPSTSETDTLSPQIAYAIVSDLMRPRMLIYWFDFLLSLTLGVLSFATVSLLGTSHLMVSGVAFAVSVLACYRAFIFLHEIVHFRARRQFQGLRRCWNVLFGFPMFVPVIMYECHAEHHNPRLYGTAKDPEYLPLARLAPLAIIKLVASAPLLPLMGPLRFGVLTPISWLVPGLRTYVYESMSSLKLDVDYKGRRPRSRAERRSWLAPELTCLTLAWAAAGGVAFGWIPWLLVLQWYLTYAGIALLDTLRLLGAHRYLGDEEGMSIVEQMLDTYNYPRRRALTELWAPVGLRLHALHHLLPGLPYHAYQEAHQRLCNELLAGSPYRLTESTSLTSSIIRLWKSSRSTLPHLRVQSASCDLEARPEANMDAATRATSR